ncbi:hypothetical protein B2J88_39200 [Rhodococcus sp. SRB_17]|uniref:SIR2 family protein n=1 Tax=Acidovorax sp. SRB_24 TaxID=1962700 RepID=UPI00145E0516|nr:SIR2 family protein [Acidovorax sp. SRB_24]NMM78901.1 hypothetical protein [Acidovorax sp. SRB_24]NMM90294.1 hypothetical protein [Rhodococcus sp. SRB_17]
MNNEELKNGILSILKEAPSSPFLFVGSGFSRRYLDLPQWDELLKIFCNDEDEFDGFMAAASQSLPQVATLLSEKYHHRWWESAEFTENRNEFKTLSNGRKLKDKTSALRWEISHFINKITDENKLLLENEIDFLKKINIDGIITTNWDNLLEKIFPEHEVFVGQEDLLFSNTQSIGEIYKIHGCASDHESLVLTAGDYSSFHKLNPYLAAKLITIFVEHPVVFIGYSMQDENIISILSSIVSVLDQDKLSRLSKNLIFVQRSKGAPASIEGYALQFGNRSIPATIVKTDDYSYIYSAVSEVEKKIPVRLLRLYKQQFYEIVSSTAPSKRMHVVNEADLSKDKEVQFVVGLTVASDAASRIGYKGIKVIDMFCDLFVDAGFRSDLILSDTVSSVSAATRYIPIFKHLKRLGIISKKQLAASGFSFGERMPKGVGFYQTKAYEERYKRDAHQLTLAQIIKKFDPSVAAFLIPFMPEDKMDLHALEKFLVKHIDRLKAGGASSTAFKKLACFYDWKLHGFSI